MNHKNNLLVNLYRCGDSENAFCYNVSLVLVYIASVLRY